MTNIVRFPASPRIQASSISRAEFERFAELALDIVDRIVAILDEEDGDLDREESGDAEPSLAAPESLASQVTWLRGSSADGELDCS